MRIAIFASGSGSNAEAIIRASHDGSLSSEVGLVVSNNANAGVLSRAKTLGVNHHVIEQMDLENDPLFEVLDENEIDFLALAGYLKLVKPELINRYRNKITNIHPALLPSFGGKGYYGSKVHEAVLDAGCKVSGVTVHLVNEEYDRGAIISQKTVPVLPGDTPEVLAKRVLKVEHEIYPETLQLFAEDRVEITDNTVRILDKI